MTGFEPTASETEVVKQPHSKGLCSFSHPIFFVSTSKQAQYPDFIEHT